MHGLVHGRNSKQPLIQRPVRFEYLQGKRREPALALLVLAAGGLLRLLQLQNLLAQLGGQRQIALGIGHGLLLLEGLQVQSLHVLQKLALVGLYQPVVRMHQLLGQCLQIGAIGLLQGDAQGAPRLGAVLQVLAFDLGEKGAVWCGLVQQHFVRGGREPIPSLGVA